MPGEAPEEALQWSQVCEEGLEMLPPARFSLLTAKSLCAKTSTSLKPSGTVSLAQQGLDSRVKINIDVFLYFLSCLRAVLAVAEAVNDPWQCLPAAPAGQWGKAVL